MSSRWQANKIGLINFWYYDEQEFPFVKGRMLLRGANGSGKSVTMQSVVPLLLDGNMSPERLDPFGSRDRKMSSYLLEEDDKREERTGYLYLEFKREDSETYITIGMGIRARKGKPLDKWYFSLTDGRRIGKDFFLYKETDEKVTLTKKELENRIQGGGRIFDRQIEYMEYVNQQIFGFDTAEEYKEMIDLLIQLRTPKLSKDFKPSVINDILSDSLQPLSDDDLRPMAEAIENMDTMTMNLRDRQTEKQAIEKINRVLEKYNKVVLYEKAEQYAEACVELKRLEEEERQKREQIELFQTRIWELDQEKIQLEAKKEAMTKEEESLRKSDAVGLKKHSLELEQEISRNEEEKERKEYLLEKKQEEYILQESKQKAIQNKKYQKEQELQELLEEMQENAEDMCFEEHTFFEDEFKEQLEESFSFETHQEQLDKTCDGIRKGTEILREVNLRHKQYEETLLLRERKQRETDSAQRKAQECENVCAQTKNEWKELLYRWNGQNQELVLPKEMLREFSKFADAYDEKSDFGKLRKQVADVAISAQNAIGTEWSMLQKELQETQSAYERWKTELAEWENQKEPEPERKEEVLKNRELLRQNGIPYQEFYKVIEFGQNMEKEDCDRLEEALLSMGILDALVMEEAYKEQVLSMKQGTCDKYLFVQKQSVSESLLDVLELDDSVNDIFLNQTLTSILGNISYNSENQTAIYKEGKFQLGVLTGTITGNYEAGFIGTQARERNRQNKIQACKENITQLEIALAGLENAIKICNNRKQKLEDEYDAFPGNEDLNTAYDMLRDALRLVYQLQEEGKRFEKQLQEILEQLQEQKKEVLQIAEKLYLPCNYEAFVKADESAHNYRTNFVKLKSGHEAYLYILSSLADVGERMEDLDGYMDQIRYDMGNIVRKLKQQQEEYDSVKKQLALTNYEQIKGRLDYCLKWLGEYDGKRDACTSEKSSKETQIIELKRVLEKETVNIQETRRKTEYLKKRYEAESALGYVSIPENLKDDVEKVRKFLGIDGRGMQKDNVTRNLSEVYYENRGLLGEYQPTQVELFAEFDEMMEKGDPTAKRMDIQARYHGTKVSFKNLQIYLEEQIADLERLIKDGDRELFEDILANTVSRKIRGKINASTTWVEKMNVLMGGMNTSSSMKLSLRWRSKTAEHEEQLDTKELVELLKKDYRLMREEEAERLSMHFRSKVTEARRRAADSGGMISFYQMMKEALDYRRWFEFHIFVQKNGERQKELTNSVFGTFSGGEKAMSMYVPLFSAVVAKYQGGHKDAPRLIALDEAFAGVDTKNIREMFQLMAECQFNFIINSQVLWGDCDTLDALAIYQLLRPENAKFVTIMPYLWNGKVKVMLENEDEIQSRAEESIA